MSSLRRLLLVTCLLSSSIVVGCSDRKHDFTLDEFAEASGANYWKIQIPDDFREGESLATAWYRGAEFIRLNENLAGFAPGSVVKAFAFHEPGADRLRFPILGESSGGGRMTLHAEIMPPDGYLVDAFHATGTVVIEGQVLVRAGDRRGHPHDEKIELRLIRWKAGAPVTARM